MAKVSVIIPIFNAEKYLRKCVDSVLAQTLDDFEIILVDDGSTDGSPNICDEYAKRPNVTAIHQMNSGASCARNAGIMNATGEYIAFVDADDYIVPQMYEEMYRVAKEAEVDIVFCNFVTIDENGENEMKGISYMPADEKLNNSKMRKLLCKEESYRMLWFPWKSIYRKSLILNYSIVFQNGNIGEDTLFNLNAILYAKNCWFIDKAYYYYVQVRGSITRGGGYKSNFYQGMNSYYITRKAILEKHHLAEYQDSLYRYNMTHSIVMILSNEKNNPGSFVERIRTLKEIRNTELAEETFENADVRMIHSRIRWGVMLLKYRFYVLLALMLS